jgi:hypothetical protein
MFNLIFNSYSSINFFQLIALEFLYLMFYLIAYVNLVQSMIGFKTTGTIFQCPSSVTKPLSHSTIKS